MTKEGKMKIKLFVQGDTEEYYFKNLRKSNNVEIVYKEINMGGGGYTSFLREVKKSGDLGYIAVFIVIDMDRFIDDPGERQPFEDLISYCRKKSKNGRIPYFLIATNRGFEFFACTHCPSYNNSDTTDYIIRKFKYKNLDEFKADEKIYNFLNSNTRSSGNAIKRIRTRKPYISHVYKKDIKRIDITIKITDIFINKEALSYYHSNIYELFDIIGAESSSKQ